MQFPKEFFEKEDREGFVVSEMMKRAWAAEMEVLAVIDDVCMSNGIRYYAGFGTLLGAVRHKGFIPWDDDIDICMLRRDYERFVSMAPDILPEGFVIAGVYGSEPRLWDLNGELQARVIADDIYFPMPKYMNRFHAFPYPRVGVDVFPLDHLPDDPEKQLKIVNEINDLQYTANHWHEMKEDGRIEDRLARYDVYFGIHFDRVDETKSRHDILAKANEIASSVKTNSTGNIANVIYLNPPRDSKAFTGYNKYREEWFGEGIRMPFEYMDIPVPAEYDKVLKATFGADYMTPKPMSGLHEYPFYKIQEQKFIDLLKESGIDTPVDEFCSNWHNMIGGM